MMPAASVLIGVVSYGSGDALLRCIESVHALPDVADRTVCVVDNCPSSGDGRRMAAAFPKIQLIESPSNDGYGAGMNRAFRSRPSDYFLVLNPDTRLWPGTVDRLVSILADRPDLGIAAPSLYYPDGRPQPSARRFYTLPLAMLEATDLNLRFPRNSLLRHHTYGIDRQCPTDVDWVNGAGLMIRSPLFKQLGGFDTRYFMYFEEVDLCRRVRQSGHGVAFVPDARLTHERAHSTASTDLRQTEFHKSLCRYFRSHHGLPSDLALRAVIAVWRLVYLSGIAALDLVRGRLRDFPDRAAPTLRLLAWLVGGIR